MQTVSVSGTSYPVDDYEGKIAQGEHHEYNPEHHQETILILLTSLLHSLDLNITSVVAYNKDGLYYLKVDDCVWNE